MKRAVIVDGVRTPFGRSHATKGSFRQTRSEDLAATCIRALLDRQAIDPASIDDVLFGATQQTGAQGANVARQIALLAGLPPTVPAATINRLCGSSLQALHQAAHAIMAGEADIQIVGGVEHLHHLPMSLSLDVHPGLAEVTSRAAFHMGLTAEYLAAKYQISRERQDQFALRSHQRAAQARQLTWWRRQITPTPALDDLGRSILLDQDPCVRESSTLAALTALKPAFLSAGGSVTAGNSSPLNDGAAALLVMSEETCRALRLTPLAAVRTTAVVGVEPSVMGIGPVAAIERALQKSRLTLDQCDFIEINEAFAVQTIACLQLLNLASASQPECDPRVNAFGGAIAIGHPLGASGARLAMNLALALREQDKPLGVAAMCIGLGQGIATVLERVA